MSQLRIQEHQKASSLMAQGAYTQAIPILKLGFDHFGPHVGLLCDLAACYYMTGKFPELKTTIQKIRAEVSVASDLLTKESLARTYLLLGKLEEETLQLSQALDSYNQAASLEGISDFIKLKAQAQRMRLCSTLGLSVHPDDYSRCFFLNTEISDERSEVEHALILAESQSVSIRAAVQRWTLSKNQQTHKLDKNLFFYDLLKVALEAQDLRPLMDLKFFDEIPEATDVFESTLLEIYESKFLLNYEKFYQLSKSLSPFSFLRIVTLSFKLNLQKDVTEENIRSLIASLDRADQKLIENKWKFIFEQKETLYFEADEQNSYLKSGRQTARLTKQEESVLKLFLDRKKLDTETALKSLFDQEFTDEAWSRLRVLVYRINKKISKELGIPNLLQMGKSEVKLLVPFTVL